ncbi:unnamed protein product, partial [Ectocarpus sp. 8 AP-2014]
SCCWWGGVGRQEEDRRVCSSVKNNKLGEGRLIIAIVIVSNGRSQPHGMGCPPRPSHRIPLRQVQHRRRQQQGASGSKSQTRGGEKGETAVPSRAEEENAYCAETQGKTEA